jgi:hypothetical protein
LAKLVVVLAAKLYCAIAEASCRVSFQRELLEGAKGKT